MPYFALRENAINPETLRARTGPSALRKYKDLSFLKTPSTHGQDNDTFGIHEAQVSIVVHGTDQTRWVTYAFSDTEFQNLYHYDDEEDDDDDNDEEDQEGHMGVKPDPILSDQGSDVDAGTSINDPREYFLTAVDSRMKQILGEWTRLVRRIEKNFEQHVWLLLLS